MSVRSVTRHRLGLSSLLVGLVGEAAVALPFLAPAPSGMVEPLTLILHSSAAICTGIGAAILLAGRDDSRRLLAQTALFIFLATAIPFAGTVTVLVITIMLLARRTQPSPARPDLVTIHEPNPATDLPAIPEPLVSMIHRLEVPELHHAVLGMADMPSGRTRPLLHRLRRHPDPRVRIHAAGLINDQIDDAEQRLALLAERSRNTPRDLPTLLAIVECHLQVIDDMLVPHELIPHTAQHGIHAAEAVMAVAPNHPEALHATARFQMATSDFHGAYGTILRLHQWDEQKTAASELLARLSFEYAACQPVVSTSPPVPPPPRVQARLS